MPRVPVAQRRVTTTAAPSQQISPNAPSSAFGVQAPTVVGQVVGAINPLIEKERERMDIAAVTEAETARLQIETDLEIEAKKTLKGKDAVLASAWMESKRRERLSEIEQKLTGRQKEVFRQRADRDWTRIYAGMERYATEETDRYEETVFSSGIKVRLNKSIADPSRAGEYIGEAKSMLRRFAQTRKWSPEETEEKLSALTSEAHSGVINRLLSVPNGDKAATAYMAAHRDEIVGDARIQVEKALEVGTRLGNAQRNADAIMSKPDITESQAYALAKEIKDATERQDTERELDTQWGRRNKAERADYEDLTEKAFTALLNTGSIPAPLMARLKPKEIIAVRSYQKQLAEDRTPETDWNAYYNLRRQAADPAQRKKFIETNLLGYRHVLGDTEFKELVREQGELRTGKVPEELRGFLTVNSVVNDALPKGVKPNTPEANAFLRAVDQEVISWRRSNNNREIPVEEARKITSKVALREVSVGRSRKPIWQVTSDDDVAKAVVPFFQIPRKEREGIIRTFQKAGRAPTTALIERAWAAQQRGDLALVQQIIMGDY